MIYGILFLITLSLSFLELSFFKKYTTKEVRTSLLLILCLILIVVSGLRFETGTDYFNYEKIFNEINRNLHRESAFVFLNLLVKKTYNNFNLFLIITAIFSIFLKYIGLKRYALYPITAIFIYTSNFFLRWEMGSIRVGVASGLIILSMPYIKRRNFIKFIFIILIAFLFHRSVIIFLPVYFISNKKYSIKIILVILTLILIISNFGWVYNSIIELLKIIPQNNFIYNRLRSYVYNHSNRGASLVTFSTFRKLFIIILALIFREDLREKCEYYDIYLNNVLIGYMLYFLFITSFFTLAVRLPSLFVVFEVFLLSSFLAKNMNRNNKYLLYIIVVTLCLGSYLMHLIKWKDLFIPYQFISIL